MNTLYIQQEKNLKIFVLWVIESVPKKRAPGFALIEINTSTRLFINDVRRRSTLPQGPPCSTIDAERLSFRVRNGTGRFPLAMAAETLSRIGGTSLHM